MSTISMVEYYAALKPRHAAAPWRVEPDQNSHGCMLAIVDANGEILARTPECEEYGAKEQAQDLYNAHVMAAGAELLAALKALRAEVEDMTRRCGWAGNGARALSDAAIDKAEGRS